MAGRSPGYAQHGLEGTVPEYVICHLVEEGSGGIKGDARSRHFDHTDVTFTVPDCHRVCQADPKTVQNVLKHIGFAMVMFALAEPVPEQLRGDPNLPGRDALLKIQLVPQGEVEPEKVFYMVGNSMVAVADDPADITADLELPDDLNGIADQGNGFHNVDKLRKAPPLEQPRDL